MFYQDHGREMYFTLMFPIVSWTYICKKLKGVSTWKDVARTLHQVEKIEVFLAAKDTTKSLILSSLNDDVICQQLMDIVRHFDDFRKVITSCVWKQN